MRSRSSACSPAARPASGAAMKVLLVDEFTVLVDEFTVLRQSLCWFLGDEPGFQVCGDVGTVTDAVVARWDPDLIVHELLLPDCAGPEVVRRLRSRFRTRDSSC